MASVLRSLLQTKTIVVTVKGWRREARNSSEKAESQAPIRDSKTGFTGAAAPAWSGQRMGKTAPSSLLASMVWERRSFFGRVPMEANSLPAANRVSQGSPQQ